MVRNLVMVYVSFVSELVGNISYGSCGLSYTMFAMVVTCKKEDGRETIADQ